MPEDLDRRTLAGLRAGDARALEDCYRSFGARVYRVCRGILRQDQDAEDATQEVFLKVLERARQFEGRARFSTWLHRMAVNHCLHRIEKADLRRAEGLDEGLVDGRASPVDEALAGEARGRVDELLGRLSAQHRAVLVLREVEGLAYAEIAEVLDLPVGTVMSRLARARERLAALIEDEQGERVLPGTRSAS